MPIAKPSRLALEPMSGEFERGLGERRTRVLRAAGLVAAVLAFGTLGYALLSGPDVSLLDCLYMTVITISTVGFEEVLPVTGSTELTLFTIALVLVGGGSVLYFFTSVTVFLVEGDLLYSLWRRRMEKTIAQMHDHVIVAGVGRSGIHVVRELHENGTPLVVVESDSAKVDALVAEFGEAVPAILGDALDDTTLHGASIAAARGLVAALREDRDNLFLCLSARQINPDLRIVARLADIKSTEKFRKVGVNAVVSPALMGGRRLAHEIVRPAVVSFVDTLHAPSVESVEMAEVTIETGSEIGGTKLQEANLRRRCNCLVIGIRGPESERYRYNPSPDEILEPEGTLLALGDRSEIDDLRALARTRS